MGRIGDPLASLAFHSKFFLHMCGVLPKMRTAPDGKALPGRRASNKSVAEVQGFVDIATFQQKYSRKGPVVFRQAATKEWGFDMDCLREGGRSIDEALEQEIGDTSIRVFRDQYDDDSAEFMAISEYIRLTKAAEVNSSVPSPTTQCCLRASATPRAR